MQLKEQEGTEVAEVSGGQTAQVLQMHIVPCPLGFGLGVFYYRSDLIYKASLPP